MIPVVSGILMLILPAIVIWKSGRGKPLQKPYLFSVGSFACCAAAILQELYTIKRRLAAGDISGIEDTIQAVIVICIVLIVLAVLLNWLALALAYEEQKTGKIV